MVATSTTAPSPQNKFSGVCDPESEDPGWGHRNRLQCEISARQATGGNRLQLHSGQAGDTFRSKKAVFLVDKIQIRPKTNIFHLVINWNKVVVKYTHFPQALDPAHLVNRHWFIFRREATVSKDQEIRFNGDENVVNLLYGEAKRNVLSGRYICTPEDVAILAALQIQINLGNADPLRRPAGYISRNRQFLENIVPAKMVNLKRPADWERLITDEHVRLKGTNVATARIAYLNMVRQWRCYGCSFFPVCHDPPPAGFFEFRIQKWIAGVGPEGIVVFERHDKSKYHFIEEWTNLKWIHSEDTVILYDANSTSARSRHFRLISPQATLIHNLAARLSYLSRKVKLKDLGQSESAIARFIATNPPPSAEMLRSRKNSHDVLGKVQEADEEELGEIKVEKTVDLQPQSPGAKFEANEIIKSEAVNHDEIVIAAGSSPIDNLIPGTVTDSAASSPPRLELLNEVSRGSGAFMKDLFPHIVVNSNSTSTRPSATVNPNLPPQLQAPSIHSSRPVSRADEALNSAMEQAVLAASLEVSHTPASIRKTQPKTLASFQKKPSTSSFLLEGSVPGEIKTAVIVEHNEDAADANGASSELASPLNVASPNPRRKSHSSILLSNKSRQASFTATNAPGYAPPSVLAELASVASQLDIDPSVEEAKKKDSIVVKAEVHAAPGISEGMDGKAVTNDDGKVQSNSDLLKALEDELTKLNTLL
ncbi:FERM domain-containing protein 8 [Phlyctochytrium planicorne]|nr:FERM domain-containing protein 8 [Phlyctochytrium planicorne]